MNANSIARCDMHGISGFRHCMIKSLKINSDCAWSYIKVGKLPWFYHEIWFYVCMHAFTLVGSGAGCINSWWAMHVDVKIRSLHLKCVVGPRWQTSDTKHSVIVSSTNRRQGTSVIGVQGGKVDNSVAISVSIALLTVNTIPLDGDASHIHRTGSKGLD